MAARVGIAYHLFWIYVGNLYGCGMGEMVENDFENERIFVMVAMLALHHNIDEFALAGNTYPTKKLYDGDYVIMLNFGADTRWDFLLYGCYVQTSRHSDTAGKTEYSS